MKQLVSAFFALFLLASSPCHAQMAPELPTIPESILADLQQRFDVDRVKAWDIGTEADRLLVQVAYTGPRGGNAYFFAFMLYRKEGPDYLRTVEIKLPDAIKRVVRHEDWLDLTLYHYEIGDGRSCPSGERPYHLTLP